ANPQTIGHATTAQDKDGRIYDPRQGLGGYYRYGPRNVAELGKDLLLRNSGFGLPRIHASALRRIQNNAHSYAPKGIPAKYDVVTDNGELLSPEQNPYETTDQALARSNTQEKAWNTIWWRRIVYFATVAVSVYLVAFPLMRAPPRDAELMS